MQRRKLFAVALAGVLASGGLAACSDSPNAGNKNASGGNTFLTVGMPNGPQTENHNPFLTTSAGASLGYRWMLYEPLMMWNPVKPADPAKPWLATGAEWAPDFKKVTITVRDNATWSDGQKVTAEDVAFTFNLIKKNDAINLAATPYGEVTATGNTVTVTFKSSMFVYKDKWLGQTPIVPKHVWEKISDPSKDPNKNPVGSGPYTLKSFTPQTTTLSVRTEGYWQALPQVKELRYTSYTDNNAQTTALSDGSNEWSFVFIPNYKTVFLDKDPAHYKVWAPPVLGIHGLYINTTKKPFDDPKLRQAMNMVVNREDIFNQAEAGYFHPLITSVTGLPSPAGDAFIAPEYKGKNQTVDVPGAKALLEQAGYKLNGNTLNDPSGKPVKLTLTDPSGWSDYQTSLEIVKSNLAEIGIQASVDKANQDAWFRNVEEGNFDATFRWTNGGSTPWDIYQTVMDGKVMKPIGTAAPGGNFGRFKSDAATKAIADYANASDDAARTTALNTLQKIFVEQVPMIPVGADNVGMAYSTKNWVGWPDDTNPYGAGQPTQANALDVVLHLKPANS
ncbi:peptide ABC transporter substrate-binding protein [Actinoplanes sp. NBRC 14428]|uniref:Peptide/nickel transport system substrate-binding protein n=1 Tax=Pseudosporangium ferrugineum TaxID=439699 RepID=A0A2T0S2U1_9ACTN|nr:ABC transporter substrate-binding protein [Pseudosporangium ferrugineum]PRY27722.1 peptide/nickel transport system substrate-binding protein [Pseudosporangium ferrugineum]BCJ55508.1 peptide ABC transporter substrate-binding protein [Actinoplanes sp. NBRC 14428]